MIGRWLAFVLTLSPLNQTIALRGTAHITATMTGYSDLAHCSWSSTGPATFGVGVMRSPALPPGVVLPSGCPILGGGADHVDISTDVGFSRQGTYTVIFTATDAKGTRLVKTTIVKVNKK